MAKKVGIYINLSAGTTQFLVDMDKANAKIRDFANASQQGAAGVGNAYRDMGSHGVSGVQAVSGALRVLEGGITNNLRAAERFTANILGLGPILQAAFPVIGAIAFAGILVKVGEEVGKFYEKMKEAPEKARAAFDALVSPMKALNDGLETTNAKLENQIAKLEGRRQNTLKVALLEARDAANELAKSLEQDLVKIQAVLKENEVGAFTGFFTGTASTTDIKDQFTKLGKDEAATRRAGQLAIDAAVAAGESVKPGDKEGRRSAELAVQAAQQKLNNDLLALYNKALDETNTKLENANKALKTDPRPRGGGRPTPEGADLPKATIDMDSRITQLTGARDYLEQSIRELPIKSKEAGLKGALETGQANKEEANAGRPLENRIAKLKAEVEAATQKMNAMGGDESAKVWAEAEGNALLVIEEVNAALKARNEIPISKPQEHDVLTEELKLSAIRNEEAWRAKLKQSTDQIREEVRAQENLTAAIGKGYEATKKASIENELMSRFGLSAYLDKDKKPQIDVERENLTTAYDSKQAGENKNAIKALDDQIALETRLSQVQSQGAEAVRLATFQATLEKMKQNGATQEQIDKEKELFSIQRANAASAEVAKLDERIEAVKRLADAQVHGAEAVRQAALANTIAAMQNEPGGATNAKIDAAVRASNAQEELRISEAVGNRVNLYKKHLDDLEEERAYLNGIQVTEQNRLDIIRAGRDIENERLRILKEEALGDRSARDGVKAFFLEMQADGKSAAQSVYESFNSALEGISSNFAKLMTGQKTAWKQMFQGIGESMIKDQVKGSLQQGIKSIGSHFPGLSGATGALGKAIAGKPDGTSESLAWYVRIVGGSGRGGAGSHAGNGSGSPADIGSISPFIIKNFAGDTGDGIGSQKSQSQSGWSAVIGAFSSILKSFGGGGSGGGTPDVSSTLSFPSVDGARADGGDVSPGESFLVGEKGPEILRGASGRILSNSDSQRMIGGSNHYYSIDARGTDPVQTERAVRAAILASHKDAIATSVRAVHDQGRRVPAGAHA